MADMTVPNTILQQFGGRKFIAMTGAKDFCGDASGLQFRLPTCGRHRINRVRVDYDAGSDLYNVSLYRIHRRLAAGFDLIADVEGADVEGMRDFVSRWTGLALSL